MEEKQQKLENDIPSSYLDKFDKISKDTWKHEDFRKKVLEICDDHQNAHEFVTKIEKVFDDSLKKETFINKVTDISKDEVVDYIDKSRVKTVYWILGLVIAGLVGILLEKFGKVF